MIDPNKVKLGRQPARIDKRTLKLANYLVGEPPPPRVDWTPKVSLLGPMLNNVLGDCTIAAKGHLIQTWTANHDQQVIVSDNAIMAGYMEACGYVPGDPTTDRGGVMLDVLNWWRKSGLDGHKPFAYVSVDPANKTHAKLAVNMFGGLDVGIMLPVSAQDQEVWSVPESGTRGEGTPGSWGGHDVPIVGYGPLGPTCISWGKLITMTWGFFRTYVEEAYAVLAPEWADEGVASPSGFSLAQLREDLVQVTA